MNGSPTWAGRCSMKTQKFLVITSLLALLGLTLTAAEAWARASGGGSRGSRSFSSPARPSPATPSTPSTPSRSMAQPAPAPMAPQRPGFFGGMMGGIAGFALGGLLGGLLFGGLGHGLGGLGGGIGLFDILLIGGGIVLLFMFLRRRREQTDTARRMFQGVQQAVTMRDVAWIREHLGTEIYAVLETQCNRLRAEHRTNRLEKIEFTGADVTEAWQESGQDFVTVRLVGSMLDYTVDDTSGAVVDGSRNDPSAIDEYWTFTRPVGPNRWKLSAIQTA